MSAAKTAIYAGLITAGCALLDSMFGNSSLSEICNLLYHAPPNGTPVIGTLSLLADNADRLSLFAAGAMGAGAYTAYKGIEAIVTDKKKEAKKEKA